MIGQDTTHDKFSRQFAAVRDAVRAFLYAGTRDPHDADDLSQRVAAVLWRKFDQYDEGRPFAGWAVGVARFELLKWRDAQARSGRTGSLSDAAIAALAEAAAGRAADVPAADDGPADALAALRACVDRLAPKAREAVRMKYTDGLPIRAIAEAQGRDVGAVEMALVRARRALRACVEAKLRAGDPAGRP